MEKVALRRKIYPNGAIKIPEDIKKALNIPNEAEIDFYIDRENRRVIIEPIKQKGVR
ncbi:MAG: hypothetical protein ACOC1O_02775 [bacterium]